MLAFKSRLSKNTLNNSCLFFTAQISSENFGKPSFLFPDHRQIGFDRVVCPFFGQTYPV